MEFAEHSSSVESSRVCFTSVKSAAKASTQNLVRWLARQDRTDTRDGGARIQLGSTDCQALSLQSATLLNMLAALFSAWPASSRPSFGVRFSMGRVDPQLIYLIATDVNCVAMESTISQGMMM